MPKHIRIPSKAITLDKIFISAWIEISVKKKYKKTGMTHTRARYINTSNTNTYFQIAFDDGVNGALIWAYSHHGDTSPSETQSASLISDSILSGTGTTCFVAECDLLSGLHSIYNYKHWYIINTKKERYE